MLPYKNVKITKKKGDSLIIYNYVLFIETIDFIKRHKCDIIIAIYRKK